MSLIYKYTVLSLFELEYFTTVSLGRHQTEEMRTRRLKILLPSAKKPSEADRSCEINLHENYVVISITPPSFGPWRKLQATSTSSSITCRELRNARRTALPHIYIYQTRTTLMSREIRSPVYQIDFTAVDAGKRISSSKRRIRW